MISIRDIIYTLEGGDFVFYFLVSINGGKWAGEGGEKPLLFETTWEKKKKNERKTRAVCQVGQPFKSNLTIKLLFAPPPTPQPRPADIVNYLFVTMPVVKQTRRQIARDIYVILNVHTPGLEKIAGLCRDLGRGVGRYIVREIWQFILSSLEILEIFSRLYRDTWKLSRYNRCFFM